MKDVKGHVVMYRGLTLTGTVYPPPIAAGHFFSVGFSTYAASRVFSLKLISLQASGRSL